MLTRRQALAGMVAALGSGLASPGCTRYPDPWEGLPGPPRVLVTFPPLYNFVRNVAGDRAGLVSLCTITGPHHYTYNVRDELLLRRADLFLGIGLTLDEQFADKLHRQHRSLRYVKLGDVLPHDLLLHTDTEHEHVHADGSKCEHGDHDPHVWLGIPQARAMVARIRDELSKVDPEHASEYAANAEAFSATLRDLHARGTELLKDKKNRKIVTFHESLAYLADEASFDLDVAGVISQAPGDEPHARRLAELVKLCTQQGVRVIAIEPQYPKSSSDTLKDELKRKGVEVALVTIDPLETATREELEAPDWYVRKMTENLERLAKHLP